MSKIIFLSHWPLPWLLLADLYVLQVGVIDNKRLFVVQSRGELREGGDRQVFKEKYDNSDDYNLVWPLIMVAVKMMMMIWWHKYTGTWDHAVRGSTDHAEGEVSWKFDRHRFFSPPPQFYLSSIPDLRTSVAPRSVLRSQSSWGSQKRSVMAKSRAKIFWSKFECGG